MNKTVMIERMLDIKRQIYLSKSWKRRNDLEKHLKKLEKEFYKKEKTGKENGTKKRC